MELTGKAIYASQIKSGTSKDGKPWAIREYTIEYQNGNFTKHLSFEVFGEDKIKEFDIHKDDTITVSFDIDAHEYQGRWYNSIRAWKVTKAVTPAPQPTSDPFDSLPQNAHMEEEYPF